LDAKSTTHNFLDAASSKPSESPDEIRKNLHEVAIRFDRSLEL
jgi:hypothetical protein